ncbi:uncharacterized protein LOC115645479 [Gopherus evgoodei]|uniref:uncharacterized protein LOC115645479 n=1 Tax=Gopherus evgoodei TaxID=1825980 RepID=UPI0011CF17D0|nr:uncharacterized protein LOC115645479 [Gopherus evgoodei]
MFGVPGGPCPAPRLLPPKLLGDPDPAPHLLLPEQPGEPRGAPLQPPLWSPGDSCPAPRLPPEQTEEPHHVLRPLTPETLGDPLPMPPPQVQPGEPCYMLWPLHLERPGELCPVSRLPLPEEPRGTLLPPLLWPRGDPWLPCPEPPGEPCGVSWLLLPGPPGDPRPGPLSPRLAAPGEPLDVFQTSEVRPSTTTPLQIPQDLPAAHRPPQPPRDASPVFLRSPITPPAPQQLRDDSPDPLRSPDTPTAPQHLTPPRSKSPDPLQDTCTPQELQPPGGILNVPETQLPPKDAAPLASCAPENDQEGPNAPQDGCFAPDTVYLQYPLTADALICPICLPPRRFHLLGGVTRYLKRCHGQSTAFSCARCSLPFECQRKCKAHQASCTKASKKTTPVLRHPVPQPAAPVPKRSRATVLTAAQKPTPAPEPADQNPATGTTNAATGSVDRAPTNRGPVTSSQVARKISELRHLSAPSNLHEPAPRRASAPPRVAIRNPTPRGTNTGSRPALRAPATRGANATPQPTLRTPPGRGQGPPPRPANIGDPTTTSGPQPQNPTIRESDAAPTGTSPLSANRRPSTNTATPRAMTTRERPDADAAPAEPSRAPPTSNATTPPTAMPRGPTERSPELQGRRPAGQTANPLPARTEEPEDRQPTIRPATPWQAAWIEKLRATASFEEFDQLINELTCELSTEIVSRRTPNQEAARPTSRRPAPNRDATTRGAGRRNPSHRYNLAAASQIQKMYRTNRLKAMRKVLDGPSSYCTIPPERLYRYFLEVFADKPRNDVQRPECLHPLPRITNADGLEADFTPKEVMARLSRTKNTAPGKDGIPYSLLKKRDPGCHVLSGIFNLCRCFGRPPTSWKKAMTVLIYKKGERDDPSNWRPISLCSTMYKLYASCLAARITEWATTGGAISPAQKGFMPSEGCYEHNFLLQTVLQTTRRAHNQCAIAWLDLANAFGSIPHHHIFSTLREFGMPETFLRLIRELYKGCSTTIRSVEGETAEIPIRSGVKQGCPLSPIIFSLAMEPLLRAISDGADGFDLHGERVNVLAYADDLVLIADDPERLQGMLNTIGRVAEWTGLRFNAKKCASLHVNCSKKNSVQATDFLIQGESVVPLAEGQAYQHLGTPTGFRVRQTPEDTIQEILQDASRIDVSLLAPWQKIDALNTFLIPRIAFVLRGSAVAKVPLNKADNVIRQLVKKWLSLPQRASNELVYIAHRHGGANVPRMGDLCDIAVITHAFRLLTCPDAVVKKVATTALCSATAKRIDRAASGQDMATFLSGSMDDDFARDRGDIASLWTRARNATRRLGKRLGCRWVWSEDRRELGVLIPWTETEDTVISPGARGTLERSLKAAVRALYLGTLKKKPDQGKVYEVTSKWDSSNHFLHSGSFIRFADWRFIHRARLNCVPLNGAVRHGTRDKRCRKCGYAMETLPHVLCSCKPHARAWQLRHNAIQDRLVKAIAPQLGEKVTNRTVPGTDSPLRPDIVVMDEARKKIILVDVTVPFENRTLAFREARARKLEKYTPLADTLRSKGYEVYTDALIVGALGAWDPCNERVLRACGVGRRYAQLMRRLMVSDTIRWSRDIYTEHVTGHRQYQE